MIKTFRHKGLKAFFEKGSMAGIQAAHAPRLAAMLRRLNENDQYPRHEPAGLGLAPVEGAGTQGAFFSVGEWQLANDFYF